MSKQKLHGILFAVSAYVFWGLHPVYWKQLQHVPSVEIVSHRIFWSLVFFIIVISFRKGWIGLKTKIGICKNKTILIVPAILIGSNWALYIWAVNAGYIIETSLGYFICPLISVMLGIFFLSEKLRKLQWFAVLLAVSGVLFMTIIYGQFPWISLYLALSWGTYGLLRKKSPLNSVEGLTFEAFILVVPAAGYLIYLLATGNSSFTSNIHTSLLLIGAGVTSGLPLLVFIAGARLINLSLIGILQYIYPTLIFIAGAFIYGEVLSEAKMIGFIFIWIALAVYSADSTVLFKRKKIVTESEI
ncbi:EamA family transporter RarD [Bacteroidota bacterium]